MFGHEDYLKYTNGYKSKVANRQPIVPPSGINRTPPQDMYFKGALFIHTLRSLVDDDAKWWKLVRAFYQRFKYQNITTDQVIAFFNEQTGMHLTPIFDQYLRFTSLPTLDLAFQDGGQVAYRWHADVPGFAMPIKVGAKGEWQLIRPTTEWQVMTTPLTKETFEVATDLYFVNVGKQ
jgi:aminopeptidase N